MVVEIAVLKMGWCGVWEREAFLMVRVILSKVS